MICVVIAGVALVVGQTVHAHRCIGLSTRNLFVSAMQTLRDSRTKLLEAERAAVEEASAKAREAAESGRAPLGDEASKEAEAAAAVEREYRALESKLMDELGLALGGEEGG